MTCLQVCEIAVREWLLTEKQTNELLREQQDNDLFFGEALVKLGAISEETLMEHLNIFNRMKYTGKDDADTS